jgi:hypothetical protein
MGCVESSSESRCGTCAIGISSVGALSTAMLARAASQGSRTSSKSGGNGCAQNSRN